MLRVLAWPPGAAGELNPYARLMYRAFVPPHARILPFEPLMRRLPVADVFHLQWPESIFHGRGGRIAPIAAAKAWRVVRAARSVRRSGGIIALTIHNAEPHARLSRWQRSLWTTYLRRLLSKTDLLIGLSAGGVDAFRRTNAQARSTPAIIIPHPHYRESYPAPLARGPARASFGLPVGARVLGMIGSIRPGKRVAEAIGTFRAIARADEILFVVGECDDEGHWAEILAAADGDARVVLRRGRLSEAELANGFEASDVVLINQPTTLNSGTALAALSLDTPVIAPAVGAMPELAATVGPNWMALVTVPLAPGDLRVAIDELSRPHPASCEPLDQFAPDRLSAQLLAGFRAAIEQRAPAVKSLVRA